MPLFEYRCSSCGLIEEHLIMGSRPVPATQVCGRCKSEAKKLDFPTSVALARSSMDNAPTDNLIGADADRRWSDIHRRQEMRNKVRQESGEAGVSMVGRNEFVPVTVQQKELRTSLNETVAQGGGFVSSEPVPGRS